MIRFTDGKKEYIWNDNDEIIGMNENAAEVLKDLVSITCSIDNHISVTGIIESEGYKIIEQDEENDDFIY